jgi:hypothetical protein
MKSTNTKEHKPNMTIQVLNTILHILLNHIAALVLKSSSFVIL